MADVSITENPYLAIVNRKARNLKKKFQNIQKAETQRDAGKELNEEQLILLSTKPAVERAILDIDAIKVQLEEVAKEIALANAKNNSREPIVEEPVIQQIIVEQTTEIVVLEVATETQPIEQVAMSTQCESASAPSATNSLAYDAEVVQNILQAHIRKLLKTLHVCSRYHSITGTNLPPDVDYFGKCLLGMTSIGDFNDALSQSVKNATIFLDPVAGLEHEAIRGMNYVELGDLIDQLANHIDGGAGASDSSMDVFLSAIATPPPQPQINFFGTDEIIDEPEVEINDTIVAIENISVSTIVAPVAESDIVQKNTEKKAFVKKERKPKFDKKKEKAPVVVAADVEKSEVSVPVVPADAGDVKPPRKAPEARVRNADDKSRPERPAFKKNNTAASGEKGKPQRVPREPKSAAAKTAASAQDVPVAAPAKPVAPTTWASAVTPSAAPIAPASGNANPASRPAKSAERRAAPKPTSAPGGKPHQNAPSSAPKKVPTSAGASEKKPVVKK